MVDLNELKKLLLEYVGGTLYDDRAATATAKQQILAAFENQAAEILSLQEDLDSSEGIVKMLRVKYESACVDIANMEFELDAAKKNAARYIYWRDMTIPTYPADERPLPEEIDATFDSAMEIADNG